MEIPNVKIEGVSEEFAEPTGEALSYLTTLLPKLTIHMQYNPRRRLQFFPPFELEAQNNLTILHNFTPSSTGWTYQEKVVKVGDMAEFSLSMVVPVTPLTQSNGRFVPITIGDKVLAMFYPDWKTCYTLWSAYNLEKGQHKALLKYCFTVLAEYMNVPVKERTTSTTEVRAILDGMPRMDVSRLMSEIERNAHSITELKKQMEQLQDINKKHVATVKTASDPKKRKTSLDSRVGIYKRLLETSYESVDFVHPDLVIAITKPMYNVDEDKEKVWSLGRIKATITPQDVWITRLDKQTPKESNGPYMGYGNDHCWGNVDDQMKRLIRDRRIIEILQLLSAYLGVTDPKAVKEWEGKKVEAWNRPRR